VSTGDPRQPDAPNSTIQVQLPLAPPRSSTMQVTFGAWSERGRLHPVNEDHYLILRLERSQDTIRTSLPEPLFEKHFMEHGYGLIVADGMSGQGGEEASRLAIVTLMYLMLHFGKWNLRIDNRVAEEIMNRAERFYRHVDGVVVSEGRKGQRLQTTLTAVFGAGSDLFFAHVGHSRAYLLRANTLMRLTHDHAIGARQKPDMPIAPLVDVNSTARDLKHILTQTIGMIGAGGPRIDLERFHLADGDRVLVCTNGLTDAVDEDVIAEALGANLSPDEISRRLVALAMSAAGDDDATALVAVFDLPDQRE
jgi:PPM family protein phosphatase